jgi:hypothetical protein
VGQQKARRFARRSGAHCGHVTSIVAGFSTEGFLSTVRWHSQRVTRRPTLDSALFTLSVT